MRTLDSKTVLDLARQQQQPWIDEDVARRIAAGAAAAVEAVHEALAGVAPGLSASDPTDFLSMLEALAGDGA